MNKNFIIPLIIYPINVIVSVGETDDQLRKLFQKYSISQDDYFDDEGEEGRCTTFVGGWVLLRLTRYPKTNADYGVLAHEIFHAVSMAMRYVGMELIPESEEAYSHLMEYLTKEIYDNL